MPQSLIRPRWGRASQPPLAAVTERPGGLGPTDTPARPPRPMQSPCYSVSDCAEIAPFLAQDPGNDYTPPGPLIVSAEFSGHNLRQGQEDKPAEVILEMQRRVKRDTGVIGLDSDGSETDESYTYASVLRDIAGLEKRPRGRKVVDMAVGAASELETPPPPGWPVGVVVPGMLLVEEEKEEVKEEVKEELKEEVKG